MHSEGCVNYVREVEALQPLCRLMDSQSMTGEDLRGLLLSKWGRSYDARLQTRNGRWGQPYAG